MLKRVFAFVLVVLACVLLAACSSDTGPAEQAIKAAEEALNGVKAEAARYVPDQVKAVEDAIKAARASFDKGDYTAALSASKDLAAKAKDLARAAADKKAELTKNWEALSAELPKMMEAIQGRLNDMAKAKRMLGMDKAKLDGAKTGLAAITETWTQATEAFKAGNIADALAKAQPLKDKAAELMASLGIQAAKSQARMIQPGGGQSRPPPGSHPQREGRPLLCPPARPDDEERVTACRRGQP